MAWNRRLVFGTGKSRVVMDEFQNTRRWCLSIKWLKVTANNYKVYTAVCDCGKVCEVPQSKLRESCKLKMRDCGCGIYETMIGPDDAA